jgi:peptidyl-prolyl cis-trans isomerase C
MAGFLALTSCSSVDRPAATVNGADISMDTFESDLAAVQEGLGPAQPAAGDTADSTTATSLVTADGSLARNLLTAAIQLELLEAELTRAGVTITDGDRTAAAGQLAQQQAGWDTAPERFRTFFTDYVAAQTVLRGIAGAPEADIAADYAAGIESVGQACVSHILVATEAEANDVLERLDAGEAFSAVAAEVSTDPSAATSGGAILDQNGSPCIALESFSSGFVPEFVAGALAAEVGVPTEPIESSFGFHVILVRPFEEVGDALVQQLQDVAAATRLDELVTGADVTVSKAIGVWSPDAGRVVALSEATGP